MRTGQQKINPTVSNTSTLSPVTTILIRPSRGWVWVNLLTYVGTASCSTF